MPSKGSGLGISCPVAKAGAMFVINFGSVGLSRGDDMNAS